MQYNINVKDAVVTEKPDPLFNYYMESLWMLLIKEGLPVWLVNPDHKSYDRAMVNDQKGFQRNRGGDCV